MAVVNIDHEADVASHTSPSFASRPLRRPFSALARLLPELFRRHAERRTVVQLSRLDPHLLRDMGFDPERIADALEGSWDEVDLARYLRRRPR